MSERNLPVSPVSPTGMEILFIYQCPHCGRKMPLISPIQPAMTQCDSCSLAFPVVPVDERTIHYVKIILAQGRAAVDPDFI